MTDIAVLSSTHAAGRQKLLGHLAMLAFAAFVAGSFSLGAMAAPHAGPAAINVARFVLGTALMTGIAVAVLRGRMPRPRESWRYLLLGGLMAVFFICMFIAFRFTDPVSIGAVFTLMPLMSAGFGYLFLGQIPRGIVIASLLFAAVGSIWVIFRGDVSRLLAFEVGRGELIFFVGCICHAAYAPLVRKLNRGEPLVAFTSFTLAGTLLCIAIYGWREIVETDWLALPPVVWIAVFYLALFTTAGTTFLVQFASLKLPASKVLAYVYLTPSIVILYEGLLGHGWVGPSVAAGALITVLGLAVMAASADR